MSYPMSMRSSAKLYSLPLSALFFCLYDKVYHKQEVGFALYLLGQFGIKWSLSTDGELSI